MCPKRDRVRATRTRLAADRPASDTKVKEVTGRTWEAWFSILDRWGARERKYREIVRFLVDEHGVEAWWAQAITYSYERSRGMRLKHQQADGFTVWVSRTIAVPVEVAFDGFVDLAAAEELAHRWDDVAADLAAGPHGPLRLGERLDARERLVRGEGPSKTAVAVAHERLPDAEEAETTKAAWRQRLAGLKTFLES